VSARWWLAALLVAAALAGCGSQARSAAPSRRVVQDAFGGSPAPLAAVHAQADQLLAGGPSAFKARLKALRGYPVVVNLWASWCGPCQSEFPVYQKVAVADGRKVAFLGIDAKDSNSNAAAFLRHFPVTYPSYTDPQGAIESSINAFTAYPQTFYFGRDGKQVYDYAGPYGSVADLKKDISFYLHVT
jgi:cytochrome c biogenesis protein CcmG/thiol:disulfide interchange protein DsbE